MIAPCSSTETNMEVPGRVFARGAVMLSNMSPFVREKAWRLNQPLSPCQRPRCRFDLGICFSLGTGQPLPPRPPCETPPAERRRGTPPRGLLSHFRFQALDDERAIVQSPRVIWVRTRKSHAIVRTLPWQRCGRVWTHNRVPLLDP